MRSFVVEGTKIEPESEQLGTFTNDTLSKFRSNHDKNDLAEDPLFQAYRAFFWDLDINLTKTRPAAEALARRVLQDKPIPTVNTLVDACNLGSLTSRVSLAAFDRDTLGEELRLRFAEDGETFLGTGMNGTHVCHRSAPPIYSHYLNNYIASAYLCCSRVTISPSDETNHDRRQ